MNSKRVAGLLSVGLGLFVAAVGVSQMSGLINVPGLDKTSAEFKTKLIEVARRLGIDPDHLATVISFETAHSFNPGQKNFAGSGATGLIQFMPSTAKLLGTTIEALESMTAEGQLEYVERYFSRFHGLKSLSDVYLAVLFPAGIGKDSTFVLFAPGTKAYEQNKGFDKGSKGFVTVGDVTTSIRSLYASSAGKPRLSVA